MPFPVTVPLLLAPQELGWQARSVEVFPFLSDQIVNISKWIFYYYC